MVPRHHPLHGVLTAGRTNDKRNLTLIGSPYLGQFLPRTQSAPDTGANKIVLLMGDYRKGGV